MKNSIVKRSFKLAALGLLALPVSIGLAADVIINNFDTASEVNQWRFDFGGVAHAESFDPTMDSNGNPSSGSMQVTLNFNSGTLGSNNKGAYTRDAFFPGVDGSQFSSLQFDLKIDSGSVTDAFGNNGFFSLALRNTDNYNYVQQFGDNVRSADGWRHIVVSPLVAPDDAIRAITWQLYGGPSQNITGHVTLWFDNVHFSVVPEPSTLTLTGLGALGLLAIQRRKGNLPAEVSR